MMHETARHIHILGIGGSGLSAIAHLLLDQGYRVSGCDRVPNAAIAGLEQRGVEVAAGHAAEHLSGVGALLISSAVPEDLPEVAAARERSIPVLTRHDLWRDWSRARPTLAVAGTHGKTTTTGMLAHLLTASGEECGYLIGAAIAGLGSARWGAGPLVIEADEYARTFLALQPRLALILNVDWDHVDIFPSAEAYSEAFREFAETTLQQGGALVACGDDAGVQRALAGLSWTSYGLGAGNQWRATQLRYEQAELRFTIERAGTAVAEAALAIPGEHNVCNALGAVAAATAYGVTPQISARLLATFRGAARRFEPKGEARGVRVYDDYAHHPAEIRATIRAARSRFPASRIVVYFQPHTFSRMQAFLDEFVEVLAEADVLRVGEIYAAREGASSSAHADSIVRRMQHADARYAGDLAGAVAELVKVVRPGDILLTLGAGDSHLVGERLLTLLRSAEEEVRR